MSRHLDDPLFYVFSTQRFSNLMQLGYYLSIKFMSETELY